MAMTKLKITLEIELDTAEMSRLLQNSIERVMNNAIYVGEVVSNVPKAPEEVRERGSTLWQDCEELKPLVCKIWGSLSEATRKVIYTQEVE